MKLGSLAWHFMTMERVELGMVRSGPKNEREKHRLHAKAFRIAARDVLKAINGRFCD